MLYYCNMVRWAWLEWGLSGWLTTLLHLADDANGLMALPWSSVDHKKLFCVCLTTASSVYLSTCQFWLVCNWRLNLGIAEPVNYKWLMALFVDVAHRMWYYVARAVSITSELFTQICDIRNHCWRASIWLHQWRSVVHFECFGICVKLCSVWYCYNIAVIPSIRLSVRVYETLQYCVKPAEHII